MKVDAHLTVEQVQAIGRVREELNDHPARRARLVKQACRADAIRAVIDDGLAARRVAKQGRRREFESEADEAAHERRRRMAEHSLRGHAHRSRRIEQAKAAVVAHLEGLKEGTCRFSDLQVTVTNALGTSYGARVLLGQAIGALQQEGKLERTMVGRMQMFRLAGAGGGEEKSPSQAFPPSVQRLAEEVLGAVPSRSRWSRSDVLKLFPRQSRRQVDSALTLLRLDGRVRRVAYGKYRKA